MANPFVQEPVPTGEVILHTSLGDITLELWCREVPKACRNFLQLALEGYYDGCIFHRIVPDFIAQTGDPTGTGEGGESIYDEAFEDEINQRLKFNRRGLLAMANLGEPHTNTSQFFLTLDRTDALQGKHSIFGRVASDRTIFNLMKMNTLELEPGTDRPQYPPTIKSIEVIKQFFDDIQPRITASERKEQLAARKEARQRSKGGPKRKGAKNAALLSFGGDEGEAGDDPSLASVKFKSAHDVDESGRLSAQVVDDRGLSAQLPASFADMPIATKRKDVVTPAAIESKPVKKPRVEKAPEISASDKLKAEIASVSDALRKKRPSEEPEENGKKRAKKAAGPSALALERAKYANKATLPAEKGKRKDSSLDDMLSSFRTKVRSAVSIAPAMAESAAYEGEILEADEGDLDAEAGMSFLGHALKFKKDANVDIHKADEYSVHDPLAKQKEGFTLEDAKNEEDRRRRQGLVPGGSGRDRDGDRDRDRDRGRRGGRR